MKKLMMAVAVVCAAAMAQASTVKWMSGAVQTPTATGALSGNRLTSSSGYALKMYAWESLTDITSYTAGDMFKWYQNGAKGEYKGMTAINGEVSMNASATTATATGKIAPADDGTLVYANVLFVLEDAKGNAQWYMENAGSKASAKAVVNLSNLTLKVGGGTSTTATSWTAVPEPTSGLLLLLGMAGLALRRRRA